MKTIIKVNIQTCQITYMVGVLYMESEDIALVGISEVQAGTQQGNEYRNEKHRNAMLDRNKK